MDLNLSNSRELEFLNTMAYDLSTTERRLVKSLHVLGQSSAIMKTHKTKQTSSQRHKDKAGPAEKQISSAQVTACPTEWFISVEKITCVYEYNYGLQTY